jgi:hypothetical protein
MIHELQKDFVLLNKEWDVLTPSGELGDPSRGFHRGEIVYRGAHFENCLRIKEIGPNNKTIFGKLAPLYRR